MRRQRALDLFECRRKAVQSGELRKQLAADLVEALVVTPSAVTGLYTDNKLTNTVSTSTEDVGVQVQVTVTPTNGTVVAPGAI